MCFNFEVSMGTFSISWIIALYLLQKNLTKSPKLIPEHLIKPYLSLLIAPLFFILIKQILYILISIDKYRPSIVCARVSTGARPVGDHSLVAVVMYTP